MVRPHCKHQANALRLDFAAEHQTKVSGMPKKPKVVPINESGRKLVAVCERSKRFILNVGPDRVAFDWSMRATKLAPGTGDRPAPVLPIGKDSKKKLGRRANESD
jgi:glyoxylate utilization-related uncharacterized protein